jgi:hypothetical protein
MKTLLIAVMLSVPGLAYAAENVAKIKTLEGAAQVTRGDKAVALAEGDDVQSGDVIRTASGASLGLIFRDDTRLSLGPKSTLVVDKMVFEPATDDMEMSLLMKNGTFSVHAGQIAKLAPERTRLRIPSATLAIRGTSFLVEVDGDE